MFKLTDDTPHFKNPAGAPVSITYKMLTEHVLAVGGSGSGKTTMLTRIAQILGQRRDNVLIMLDGKGDAVLRMVAKGLRRPYWQWSLHYPWASNYFTAKNLQADSIPLILFSMLMADALNFHQGSGYGVLFFSLQNFGAFIRGLQPEIEAHLAEIGHGVTAKRAVELFGEMRYARSFGEMYRNLSKKSGVESRAPQVLRTLEQMLLLGPHFCNMEDQPHPEEIYWPNVLQNRGVVYVSVPPTGGAEGACAKIFLFSLFQHLVQRHNRGIETPQVFVIFDEFQVAAGFGLDMILQLGRSMGLAMILATQSLSQLRGLRFDATQCVKTNTRTKMFFSIDDYETAKELMDLSGEEVSFTTSYTTEGYPISVSEVMKKKLTINHINAAEDKLAFLLQVRRGDGYAQWDGVPILVHTDYPISTADYTAFEHAPWEPIPEAAWITPDVTLTAPPALAGPDPDAVLRAWWQELNPFERA